MKILFDVSALPVPGFISRSIKALSDDGMQVMVTGQTKRGLRSPFSSIPFYGRPQAAPLALLFFIYRFVSLLFIHPGRLFHLWKWTGRFSLKDRIKEFNRLSIYYISKPDVIHIQWTKALLNLEYLLDHKPCPITASVRGTQMFVSPVDPNIYNQYQKILPKLDAVHTLSEALSMATQKFFDGKIAVIPPAVKTEQVVVKKDYRLQPTLKLITVTRFHWVKGVSLLLDALVMLEGDWELTLISSNPLTEDILYQLHDLNIVDRVKIYHQLPHEQVLKMLPEHDVFIFPGMSEGRGNALLEAMASGMPVICAHFDGAEEIIHHNENGLLFRNDDVDQLKFALDRAKGIVDVLRKEMGTKARESILTQSNEQKVNAAWKQFLKEVVGS